MSMDKLENLATVDAGHFHVEKNDVVQLFLDEVDPFGAVKGEVNLVGLVFFELFFQEGRDRGFIVHDQDLVMLRHQDAPPSDIERKNLLTQHARDGGQEVDEIVRLAHKILRSVLLRLDGILQVGKTGEHDHLDFGEVLFDEFENFEPVGPGHLDIEKDQIQ